MRARPTRSGPEKTPSIVPKGPQNRPTVPKGPKTRPMCVEGSENAVLRRCISPGCQAAGRPPRLFSELNEGPGEPKPGPEPPPPPALQRLGRVGGGPAARRRSPPPSSVPARPARAGRRRHGPARTGPTALLFRAPRRGACRRARPRPLRSRRKQTANLARNVWAKTSGEDV